MDCKYKDYIIEVEPEFEPDEYGEPVLVGEDVVVTGTYCHKKKDYIDDSNCQICQYCTPC